jgi:hypothetical protein
MWKKGKINHKMKKGTGTKGESYISAKGVPGKMIKPSPYNNCNFGCSQTSEHIVTSILNKQQNYIYTYQINHEDKKVHVSRKLLMATLKFSKKKTLYTFQYAAEMNTGKPDE